MSRILVTGATGFVGKFLCQYLVKAGHDVNAAQRSLEQIPNCNTIHIPSLNAQTDWSDALDQVDYVVHLAARVHHKDNESAQSIRDFTENNVEATQNLALQAQDKAVKRFIFLSSIKVNGEQTPPDHPFNLSQTPTPVDAYGRSKLAAECLLQEISEQSEMEFTIIRPPLVYGPGVKANFRALLKCAVLKVPLPFASLHNKRSLIYVENLANIILTCLNHPNAAQKVFLVSDGDDMSVASLFKLMRQSMGRAPLIFPVSISFYRVISRIFGKEKAIQGLIHNLQLDSKEVTSALNWRPPVPVETAFERTLEWFENRQKG